MSDISNLINSPVNLLINLQKKHWMRKLFVYLLLFLKNVTAQKRKNRKEKEEVKEEISIEIIEDLENTDLHEVLDSFKNTLKKIIGKKIT